MKLIGQARPFVIIWALIVVASIVTFAAVGMNLGIDFTGGTLLERGLPGKVSVGDVRSVLDSVPNLDLSGSVVQPLDEGERPDETVMIIRTGDLTNDEIAQIDEHLTQQFGEVDNRRTEVVGPVVGSELVRQSIWALVLSGLAVLIYITFRFEYRFGVAALLGVTHDVLLVVAIVALLGMEINQPFVAAILTVVGYSLNNTIVIFDRVRENLPFRKNQSFLDLMNESLSQTMSRTINTSITTLLVLLALLVLGGPTIRDFTLAMTLGVVVGTISSVLFAPSIWLTLQAGKKDSAAKATARG